MKASYVETLSKGFAGRVEGVGHAAFTGRTQRNRMLSIQCSPLERLAQLSAVHPEGIRGIRGMAIYWNDALQRARGLTVAS